MALINPDGMNERLNSCQDRLEAIDRKNYVPSITFRWTIGILVAVILSLNGFIVGTLFNLQATIIEIKSKQTVIIDKLEENLEWIKKKSQK